MVCAPDHNGGLQQRDVLLKWGLDERADTACFFKRRPLSIPSPTELEVSTTNTLNAVGAILKNPVLNPDNCTHIDRMGYALGAFL